METPLQPGPYLSNTRKPLVIVNPTVDEDGEVRALYGPSVLDWLYCMPAQITPMDHWPEWWPFQDAALPERRPQVGDWVRKMIWSQDMPSRLVIGSHFGCWQMVDGHGRSYDYDHLDGFTVVPAPEGVDQ